MVLLIFLSKYRPLNITWNDQKYFFESKSCKKLGPDLGDFSNIPQTSFWPIWLHPHRTAWKKYIVGVFVKILKSN